VPVVVGLAFSVVVTSIRISGHEALRVVARDALVWFVVPFVAILIVQVAGTLADLVAVALAPVAKALVARIPEPDWAGWSRRHPITAAALKWANEEGAPFFVIGVGLLLAFAGPERRLVLAPAPQALWLPAGSFQVGGLALIAYGALALGLRIFVVTSPVGGGFTRPLGQMLIGTLVNWLLAFGLGWCGLAIGAALNAGDSTRAPWDTRALTVAGVLLVAQGVALPLYAWWRWFGDRDLDKMIAGVVRAMQESPAAPPPPDAAGPPVNDSEPEAPPGPHLMAD
jgi:hypothetical protein